MTSEHPIAQTMDDQLAEAISGLEESRIATNQAIEREHAYEDIVIVPTATARTRGAVGWDRQEEARTVIPQWLDQITLHDAVLVVIVMLGFVGWSLTIAWFAWHAGLDAAARHHEWIRRRSGGGR